MTNATFNTLFAGSVYLIDGKPFQSYHCAADDRLRCVANCAIQTQQAGTLIRGCGWWRSVALLRRIAWWTRRGV